MTDILKGVTSRPTRDLLKEAQSAGGVLSKTNGGHIKVTNPKNNAVVFAACTSHSRGSGPYELRAQLRRAGLDV